MFLPLYSFSAEEIFEGNILLFDVDFFNPQENILIQTLEYKEDDGTKVVVENSEKSYNLKEAKNWKYNIEDEELKGIGAFEAYLDEQNRQIKYYYYLEDEKLGDIEENRVITSKQNIALDLQPLVSQWYFAIRNIAIVLSMSVLLYIGIRMLLSTIAQEKAKYKQMLMDWGIGLCLLFFMHYIMAFSVSIVQSFNNIISTEQDTTIDDQMILMEDDEEKYISSKLKEIGMSDFVDDTTTPSQILWRTNLMGMLRLKAQVSYGDIAFVGYGLCYFILVLFTIYFIFIYLKRVLYMAFLTMIAPLVALTYSIDKLNDGQAQGFYKWLREYMFNLLIQPLHLLLYTILIKSAFDLASTNIIYSLVTIGFLIPAEKLMRSLFGFEKATTPISVAGAATGATMLNSALQRLIPKRVANGRQREKDDKISRDDDETPTRIGYSKDHYNPLDEMAENEKENFDQEETLVSDANTENERDLIKRMEREELEEKIVDGQLTKDELTEEQKKTIKIHEDSKDEKQNENSEVDRLNNKNTKETENISVDNLRKKRILKKSKNKPKLTKEEKRQGIVRATKYTLKHTGKHAKTRLQLGTLKTARTASKLAVGATVGVAPAILGATIGIATGDPSKVASFGVGAGISAGAVGASLVNDSKNRTAYQVAREKAYWGDKYDEHIENQNIKRWKHNSEKREKLEQYLGAEKTKSIYKNGEIDNYLKNDITDEKMIAAMENVKNEKGLTFNDVLAFKEAHDIYGNGTKKMDLKNKKELIEDYTEQFRERNLTKEQANSAAKKIANGVDLISDAYGKI